VLSLFVVTKCYSYSKIVSQLTVVPPGEYPINRFIHPEKSLITCRNTRIRDNIKNIYFDGVLEIGVLLN
jgi:hypothetical protein